MPKYERRWIKARNSWLVGYFPRRWEYIAGMMLHATRSGKCGNPVEGINTEGWWSNPTNVVYDENGQPSFGSFADWLLHNDGTQIQCTAVSAGEFAKWTAGYGRGNTWAAGHYYIQVELPQACNEDGYSDVVIDSIAELTAELAHLYKFPIVRLPYLTQTGTPPRGISSHDNCANGTVYGKSDPGSTFPWQRYLTLANEYYNGKGDAMTPAEQAEFNDMKMRIKRCENLLAGNGISSQGTTTVDLVGDEALEYADHPTRKWSALFGVNLARLEAAEARQIAENAGGIDGIPEHDHTTLAGVTGGVNRE